MKTREEWFNQHLPAEEAWRAVRNTPAHRRRESCGSLRAALMTGFHWNLSKEGEAYWTEVYHKHVPN